MLKQQIIHSLGYDPTPSQEKVCGQLAEFLSGNDALVFVLNGYAGTGKTTLIAALVRLLRSKKQDIVLLAPTGRAAKVLSSYAGTAASTIHRRIYKVNEETGRFELRESAHRNTLFIVDEASMVGADNSDGMNLLEDLFAFVFSGTHCRLILSGDLAQLPPVGLIASPALNPKYLRQRYLSEVTTGILDDVVRQQLESGILFNATRLREMIRQKSEDLPKLKAGFPDVIRVSGMELQDHLEVAYNDFGPEGTLFVCRSNKRAYLFNQQVRARILWQEELLSAGDRLMCVKNNYFWLGGGGKGSAFIANGDMLVVNRLGREEQLWGFTFREASVTLIDHPGEPELDIMLLTDVISTEAAGLTKEQQTTLFEEALESVRQNFPGVVPYQQLKKDPFFNALHVKYAYAVTCHKSQGGQWQAVFIDAGYLTEENTGFEYLRWLYTAITRATERIYLVNFPEQMFEE